MLLNTVLLSDPPSLMHYFLPSIIVRPKRYSTHLMMHMCEGGMVAMHIYLRLLNIDRKLDEFPLNETTNK